MKETNLTDNLLPWWDLCEPYSYDTAFVFPVRGLAPIPSLDYTSTQFLRGENIKLHSNVCKHQCISPTCNGAMYLRSRSHCDRRHRLVANSDHLHRQHHRHRGHLADTGQTPLRLHLHIKPSCSRHLCRIHVRRSYWDLLCGRYIDNMVSVGSLHVHFIL